MRESVEPDSLVDCLKKFTDPEKLTGLEQAYCSECKQHTDSTLEFRLCRVPPILMIHLKRFRDDWRHSKIQDEVTFPKRGLDLEPFFASENYSQESTVYDLRGVINHIGSTGGGHYTAFCRQGDSSDWYEYDDGRGASLP